MKLEEVFERLCINSDDLEVQALVYMLCKERILDLAEDIDSAVSYVMSVIPDSVKDTMVWKLLVCVNASYNFLSNLSVEFNNDISFISGILNKDSDFLLNSITEFAKDFMKANNIEIANTNVD